MSYEKGELTPLWEIAANRTTMRDHLAAVAIHAPTHVDYERLPVLQDQGMTFRGWQQSVTWLDLPPQRPATLKTYFETRDGSSVHRIVYSNYDTAVTAHAGEVSRQEFRVDFRHIIDATISHLPIPIFKGEPVVPQLGGEAAWGELQRILGLA